MRSPPPCPVVSWVIALVCAASTALASESRIDFDHLSLDQGLSQSIIEQIVQDRQGFMWFVTEDGLNRFDGYRFTVIKNAPGNRNSLSHNELKSVFEDHDGILWIGTFEGGLNRLDVSTGDFTRYQHDPDDPTSLSAGTVRCIFEDRSGRLWIGTQGGGLDRLDRETGCFHRSLVDPDSPIEAATQDIRAIYEDSDDNLWVGTNGDGLYRLDPETGEFANYRHAENDPTSLGHDEVFAILEDHTGTLWIGTYGGGLDNLDRDTGRFTHHRADSADPTALGSDLIKALCEDHAGTLWVATDGGGLIRFNREDSIFTSYRHNPVDPRSLSSDRLYSVHQDRSHVLWVGTYGGGLSYFDVARKKFRSFRNDPDDSNSLNHNIVWSFHEDPDGVLWIGTDSGGLNRFDRRAGRWSHDIHRPEDPSSLSHNTVRMLYGDTNGALWIATNGGGLDRFDRTTGRFSHFRHDPGVPESLSHDDLRSVTRDSSGRLWVGTFGGGLDRLDEVTGGFIHHRHDPEDSTSISNDFIRLVYEDRSGVLWVGTQGGGLNRLDPETGEFTHYRHDPNDPSSISNDHVFAIHEDREGALWVGTIGGGLNRFDRVAGVFHRYLPEHGLASDLVYAMLEDDEGRLWISTTRGLSRFDPRTETFRNYDARDGLQSNEFNGGSAYRSPSGEMFFGGIAGFNAFFPAEIGLNTEIPNVVITDFQLFNRSIGVGEVVGGRILLERPITHTDEIELSYRDNVITLEFAALHYSAPGKNRYEYSMEGFSDDWIPVGADRRVATFTGLTPGDYVFRVRGANSDGVWNTEGASIKIRVTPPFWATWWFRLIAILAVAGLAVAGFQNRIRGIRMKTQLAVAHDAQNHIMPQTDPDIAGFDISGAWLPAHGVGGDFFDYFWLEGEPQRLCIVVADVAGSGMAAAMNAVLSDGMVYSRARQGGSVEEIMYSLNRSIYDKVGRRMFTALCLLVLDPAARKLTFANAGLCEPLHKSGDTVEYLPSPGSHFPLGAIYDTAYESRSVQMTEGDTLVVFSDGVPEARNSDDLPYGYDAPVDLLASLDTANMGAEQIKRAILESVGKCCEHVKQSDDIAMVVIKVVNRENG